MHFYQFHIGDYRRDTSHLTPIEDIAYRRLLDLYYLDERPLQKDGIARKIGMREYEHDVLVVLEEFFVETECGWINKRAEAQVKQYQARVEDGKRGAAKRWGKGDDASPNSPPNSPPIDRVIPNHKPITNNQKPIEEEEPEETPSVSVPTQNKLPKVFSESPYKEESYRFANWFRAITVDTVNFDDRVRDKWAMVWDALRRIDKRDNVSEMTRAIEWARNDHFWSSNFLSPLKLRTLDKNGEMHIDRFIRESKKPKPNGSYRKNGALGAQQPLDAAGAAELDEMLRTDPRLQH